MGNGNLESREEGYVRAERTLGVWGPGRKII